MKWQDINRRPTRTSRYIWFVNGEGPCSSPYQSLEIDKDTHCCSEEGFRLLCQGPVSRRYWRELTPYTMGLIGLVFWLKGATTGTP